MADVVLTFHGPIDLKVFSSLGEIDARSLAEVIAARASIHGPGVALKLREAANTNLDTGGLVRVLLTRDELETIRTACTEEAPVVHQWPTVKTLCIEVARELTGVLRSPMIESVDLDVGTSPTELAAVQEAFGNYGFEVNPQAVYETRSAGPVPWLIAVTLTVPISGFLCAFGSAAGTDAYAAVHAWVRALWAAHAAPDAPIGSVQIDDPDGTHVVLANRIPDQALRALSDVDWPTVRGHYLVWDEEQSVWRDPTR